MENTDKCCICLENNIVAINEIKNCSHNNCLCLICYEKIKLQNCPLCRKEYNNIQKLRLRLSNIHSSIPIGINTINTTLGARAPYDIRNLPVPRNIISPWIHSSIMLDIDLMNGLCL
jgi:hypothetical protein